MSVDGGNKRARNRESGNSRSRGRSPGRQGLWSRWWGRDDGSRLGGGSSDDTSDRERPRRRRRSRGKRSGSDSDKASGSDRRGGSDSGGGDSGSDHHDSGSEHSEALNYAEYNVSDDDDDERRRRGGRRRSYNPWRDRQSLLLIFIITVGAVFIAILGSFKLANDPRVVCIQSRTDDREACFLSQYPIMYVESLKNVVLMFLLYVVVAVITSSNRASWNPVSISLLLAAFILAVWSIWVWWTKVKLSSDRAGTGGMGALIIGFILLLILIWYGSSRRGRRRMHR